MTFDETGDSDCDGLSDLEEAAIGTHPLRPDTDYDGINDLWEYALGLDPLVMDAHLDADQDGYSNFREFQLGTHIFYNTINDKPVEKLHEYSEGSETVSLLDVPSIANVKRVLVHPSNKHLYVVSLSAIHRFSIDSDSGELGYLESLNLVGVQSMSIGFSVDGNYLYLFKDSVSGSSRAHYSISDIDGGLTLVDETAILPRGVAFPPNSEEWADGFGGVTELLSTSDNRYLYVPSESLGLKQYSRNVNTGQLSFEGYITPGGSDFDATNGAILSQDISNKSIYLINDSNIDALDRDAVSGTAVLRETLTNDMVEPYETLVNGLVDGQWVVSSSSEIEIYIDSPTASNVDTFALSGDLQVNGNLTGMLYVLSEGDIQSHAKVDNTFSATAFMNTPLDINSVSVSPLDSALGFPGNYLFVLGQTTDNGDEHLLVYSAGLKGIGHNDEDGDGTFDIDDAFPLDPTEDSDSDQDGCGDNKDQFHNPVGTPMECLDTDNDGLSDEEGDLNDDNDLFTDEFEEKFLGSNPDCDGLNHNYGTSVENNDMTVDTDGDGLTDFEEQSLGSNPCSNDTDNDGLLDDVDGEIKTDSTPPELELVKVDESVNITIELGTEYSEPGFSAIDKVEGDVTARVKIEGFVDTSVPGVYRLTYTVDDSLENPAPPQHRDVTVEDTTPPIISLNGSVSINIEAGPNFNDYVDAGAKIFASQSNDVLTGPEYRRNDGDSETPNFVTVESILTTVRVGRVFEEYEVAYNASDSTHSVDAIRTVRVYASQIPVVSLIGLETTTITPNSNFVDPGVNVSDNVDSNLGNKVLVTGNVDVTKVGEYWIHYNVTDSAGNQAEEISRKVIVADTGKPVIELYGPDTIILEAGDDGRFIEPGGVAIDTVDGEIDFNAFDVEIYGSDSSSHASVRTDIVETYTLKYTVTDSFGNVSNPVFRTVDVRPNNAPTISLLGANPLSWNQKVAYIDPGASVWDEVDGNIEANPDISAVNVDVPGTYTVRITAQDSVGNFAIDPLAPQNAYVERTVEVVDLVAPVFELSGVSTIDSPKADASTVYHPQGLDYLDITPVAVDSVDGEVPVETGVFQNGFFVPMSVSDIVDESTVGTYEITYQAQDNRVPPNLARANRFVIVIPIDHEKPSILVTDSRVYSDNGQLYIDHEQGEPLEPIKVEVTDNQDGSSTQLLDASSQLDTSIAGDFQVTLDVTDLSGNQSDSTIVIVRVRDRTSPEITLYGKTVDTYAQYVDFVQTYVEEGGVVVDNIDGEIPFSEVTVTSNVDTSQLGEYSLTYSVQDLSGNLSVVSRIIRVADLSRPVLTLNGSDLIYVEQGTEFIDPGVTAFDRQEGELHASNVIVTGYVDSNLAGSYQILYEVQDSEGNSAIPVQRTVIVQDTLAPLLTLLGASHLHIECGVPTADPGASASDFVDGDLSENVLRVGDLVIPGDGIDTSETAQGVSIEYSVSDSAENISPTIVRNVTVVDTAGPDISVVGGSPQHHEQGEVFLIPEVRSVDLCEGNISNIAIDGQVDFNVAGQYQLTISSEDSLGNESTPFVLVVNVQDTTSPIIELVGSSNTMHEQGTAYTDLGATAIDNVDGNLSEQIVVTGMVDINVAGTYLISYDVSDSAGNIATTVQRSVEVADTTSPVILLNGSANVIHEQGTPYADEGATAIDSVDGNLESAIVVSGSVDVNTAGTYLISYDVMDAIGNAATTVQRTVTVADTTLPVITLNGSAIINHEQGATYNDLGANASDSVDGNLDASIVVNESVDVNTAGTYFVSYDVMDSSGNAAVTVQRTVIVADTTLPVISLIGNSSINHEQGTAYTDPGATASDSVDGNLDLEIVVSGSVDVNTAGTYQISYDVTDEAGNAAITIQRAVTVSDTVLPVITLNGSASINHEQGTAYSDLGATASDSVDGNLDLEIVVSGSVDVNAAGIYLISYDVMDAAGNAAATVQRTVTVADTTAPVITLNDSASVHHEQGTAYGDAGATATDNIDGNLTGAITVDNPVNVNVAGTYLVTYNVSDSSGNAANTVQRSVTVSDTTVPVITLNGSAIINHEQGTVYNDAGATAIDNIDGNLTGSITVDNLVDVNIAGIYLVTYNVSDLSGNMAATVQRTVSVSDTTSPVITLNGGASVHHEQGSAYADAGATAVDNIDGNLSGAITVDNPVNVNVAGTYLVTYSVSDLSGNAASTVQRSVTVSDTTVPVITLNGSGNILHEQGTAYSDEGATAADNIDGNLTGLIDVFNPVDVNVAGAYVVTYNVSDLSGNAAATVQRMVTISDTTIPVITLNGSAIVHHEQGTAYADAGATATDNIDGNLSGGISVDNPVNVNVAGTYLVTYNVSDTSGNAAVTVQRSVTVSDTSAPVITLNGSASIHHEQGAAYIDAGATAIDNIDGNLTDVITVDNPVNVNVAGTYLVTYNVSDSSANAAATVQRSVTVADTSAPVITLNGSTSIHHEQGTVYNDAGATAADNIDGNLTGAINVDNPVDVNVAGTYLVSYNVSDSSGNAAATVQRTVTVADTLAPVITLSGSVSINHEQGTPYFDSGATAVDNVDGNLTADIIATNTVDVNTAGSYLVTYNVSDSSGNAEIGRAHV